MRELFSRPFAKFFADRGTHLAAMIAYFALLSFLPLTFLALALLGLAGRADESSALVTELQRISPSSSVSQVVRAVNSARDNAATLGIIGGSILLWSSLSFFSVLESAFNVVYGRPNRGFLRGKALAAVFMISTLTVLFAGLVVGTIGFGLLTRHTGGVFGSSFVAVPLSLVVSTGTAFVFLVSAYFRLTNEKLTVRDVLPGAAVAAVALQGTFQVLPLFLRASKEAVALQALGAPALLLVWLYVMSNVIVFGAELNWYLSLSRRRAEDDVAGLA